MPSWEGTTALGFSTPTSLLTWRDVNFSEGQQTVCEGACPILLAVSSDDCAHVFESAALASMVDYVEQFSPHDFSYRPSEEIRQCSTRAWRWKMGLSVFSKA